MGSDNQKLVNSKADKIIDIEQEFDTEMKKNLNVSNTLKMRKKKKKKKIQMSKSTFKYNDNLPVITKITSGRKRQSHNFSSPFDINQQSESPKRYSVKKTSSLKEDYFSPTQKSKNYQKKLSKESSIFSQIRATPNVQL